MVEMLCNKKKIPNEKIKATIKDQVNISERVSAL